MADNTGAPDSVSIRTFLAARTQELVALSQKISGKSAESKNNSVPFKHIPKNLRRRAVSHNVKRLPFRFRPKTSAKAATGSKGDPLSFISSKTVKKSGSRKQKRRKGNLLLEFNRRQREFKWLETHIWHAKRFHMEAKWNHKIPIAPCDKGRRALYRSTKNYATMQDISYLTCFEIQGDFNFICSGFKSIAPTNCNTLSVGAVMYKSGEREGKLYLYKKDSYPYGYIGEVRFYWLRTKRDNKSLLHLWVHPAFSEEVLQELLAVFELNSTPEISLEEVSAEGQSIDQIKLQPKSLSQKPVWSNVDGSVCVIDMSGAFNRIRFCGPEVATVLKEVLHATPLELIENCDDKWLSWFNKQSDMNGKKYVNAQALLWEAVDNMEDFPSQAILPLVVRDPRVFLPQKRTKVLLNNEASDAEEEEMEVDGQEAKPTEEAFLNSSELFAEFLSQAINPLEDSAVPGMLLKEKMTDEEFCKRRAGLLIPGSQVELGSDENQVPVVLIHRPATANARHFSDGGFDLLIPPGWMMAFWIAFAYRAVRVTGLRDAISCAFETANIHSSLFLPPDSQSGSSEETQSCSETRSNYFKLPPAKRPNLIKLGCSSPFTQDWLSLLSFWNDLPISSYFIIRDREKLNQLSRNLKTKFWKRLSENLMAISSIENCLIAVRLELLGRGTATKGAVISIPAETDKLPPSQQNVSESPVHEEPPWDDKEFQKQRSDLHTKHVKNMSFLSRKRKKLRLAQKGEQDPDLTAVQHYDSTELSRLYNEKINELWLIPKSETIPSLDKLTRKPMGFVVYGGNEYSRGKCSALGYISAKALLQVSNNHLANKKLPNFLLLRNWSTSFVHRAVKCEILQV